MTEDDARAILAEVEPEHAREERTHRLAIQSYEDVVIEGTCGGSLYCAQRAEWRPRATRTASGWTVSGGWLDEPVPPLPTRGVPNSGGVACIVAGAATREGTQSIYARHRGTAVWEPRTRAALLFVDLLDVMRAEAMVAIGGATSVASSAWAIRRAAARRGPSPTVAVSGRGWCRGLVGSGAPICDPGTPRDWQATKRVCAREIAATDAAWAAERAELTQRTEAA